MKCTFSKILLFMATSGLIGFIVYRWLFETRSRFEGTVSSLDAEHVDEEKRKFVTLLSKDNDIKIVYVDNDHIEDTEDPRLKKAVTNTPGDVTSTPSLQSYYESSSAGTENPYSIEWDETIDYDHYGKIAFNETKRSMDLSDKPKDTIVLVQERYHSNSPITNIMYRYGDQNQLTFALPKKPSFQGYRPLRFHPSFVDTSLTFSSQINMLINPTYRYETLRRFMPMDTVFIAVLYDPVKSLISRLVSHPLFGNYKLKKRLKIVKKLVRRRKVFGDEYTNC
ncbi:uncharacterized protein LOC114517947 [Dendronephthya gigantea]|uniref:uncharacterized protein LOC114517947 n=1 Tax=Dendronephthya gigantea TaxID=151771 RepID=UPI00106B9D87|nr:uncharacterized protein LOC114517947 [Dendronephthya gigantea]